MVMYKFYTIVRISFQLLLLICTVTGLKATNVKKNRIVYFYMLF
jgi:hypothetical protein